MALPATNDQISSRSSCQPSSYRIILFKSYLSPLRTLNQTCRNPHHLPTHPRCRLCSLLPQPSPKPHFPHFSGAWSSSPEPLQVSGLSWQRLCISLGRLSILLHVLQPDAKKRLPGFCLIPQTVPRTAEEETSEAWLSILRILLV